MQTSHASSPGRGTRLAGAKLRHLLESAPDAIVIADGDGKIVLVNRMTERLSGYRRGELIGQPIELLVPENLRATHVGHRSSYHAAPRTRFMGVGMELYLACKDGGRIPVEISLSPMESEGGTLVTTVIRDVTERRRYEEVLRRQAQALARSNAELEQFAYVASHDLQEPLRMVGSFAQLLSRRYGDRLDDEAQTYIRHLVDGAKRMQALINDLLDYSRLGPRQTELVPVDLNDVAARVIHGLQPSIDEAGARVTFDTLPTVNAIDSQMAQVLQNLIANAVKFNEDTSPKVHVSAEQTEEGHTMCVTDNGIGIDPQFAERIFAVFQRLHPRDEYRGTGIGLAICKKIVEHHGGRIWVESGDGNGSRFYFTLPATQTQEGDRT